MMIITATHCETRGRACASSLPSAALRLVNGDRTVWPCHEHAKILVGEEPIDDRGRQPLHQMEGILPVELKHLSEHLSSFPHRRYVLAHDHERRPALGDSYS